MTRCIATATLLACALAACGYDATPPQQTPASPSTASPPAPAPGDAVSTGDAQPARLLGVAGDASRYLTDASGSPLYYLDDNADGRRCDDACQRIWPPVTAQSDAPVAPDGVEQPELGALQIGQGANHLTYHGHPLYRYAGDRGARTTSGHDVQDDWGHWRLMGVDGQPAPPPPEGTDTGNGAGSSGQAPTGR